MPAQIDWPNGKSAALTITFDDGFADTYHETCGWLAEREIKATYFLISRYVGKCFENIATANWENWRLAAGQGHEVASHGATHATMAGLKAGIDPVLRGILSAPDRFSYFRQIFFRFLALRKYQKPANNSPGLVDPLSEPQVSRQEIRQHLPNCQVLSFSYPAGRLNLAACQAVEAAGYLSARGNQAGINIGGNSPFTLRNLCLGPGLTLPELEPWLRRTLDQSGWLIITFHLVSKNNSTLYPYHCSVSGFRQMIHRIEKLPFWVTTQQAVVTYLQGNMP